MRANWIDQALYEHEQRRERRLDAEPVREAEATIGGDTVPIGDSETKKTASDTWLSAGAEQYGIPRGREALEARRIARTEGFQIFVNAIVDQLLGGELAFPDTAEDVGDDETVDGLKDLLRDVFEGPHLLGTDFDDLVAAWVDDMAAIGECVTELLPASDNSLPVVAMDPVDVLTTRRNVDKYGNPRDPPWFQAPYRSVQGAPISADAATPTKLEEDQLLVMRWPGANRSDRVYPYSPAMQVKQWLEMIADSTTHHSRFYSDNELPPGVVSVRDASSTDIENIRDEIQAAKGDPRAAPVVGTDARWVEIGGSAVDLSVVEEQEWFIQLCGAALGVPKVELSMDDQVNYSTSATEERIIHKRVTRPVAKKIGKGLSRQVATQFDLFNELGRPFDVELRHTNPAQDRAEEEHYLDQLHRGGLTFNEFYQRTGKNTEEIDTTVVIGGEEIDYGDLPFPVLEAKLRDASSASDADLDDEDAMTPPGAESNNARRTTDT